MESIPQSSSQSNVITHSPSNDWLLAVREGQPVLNENTVFRTAREIAEGPLDLLTPVQCPLPIPRKDATINLMHSPTRSATSFFDERGSCRPSTESAHAQMTPTSTPGPFDARREPSRPYIAPDNGSSTWYIVTVGRRVGVFDNA